MASRVTVQLEMDSEVAEALRRLGVVLGDALAGVVHDAEIVLGYGVALLGGLEGRAVKAVELVERPPRRPQNGPMGPFCDAGIPGW